jgi:hypothetical protein
MTQKQALKKIKELLKDIKPFILTESERLLKSGVIDTKTYQDNYLLPKIILTVALKNASFQYAPFHPDHKREVLNLSNF